MFTYKGCSFELSGDVILCRRHYHKCTIILMSLDYFTVYWPIATRKKNIWCNFYTGCFCILWDVVRYVFIYYLFPCSQIPDLSVKQPSILQWLSTKPIPTAYQYLKSTDKCRQPLCRELPWSKPTISSRHFKKSQQCSTGVSESGTWFSFIEPLCSRHIP